MAAEFAAGPKSAIIAALQGFMTFAEALKLIPNALITGIKAVAVFLITAVYNLAAIV